MQSETIQYHLQTGNSKRTKIGETARADISTNKITKEKKTNTHTNSIGHHIQPPTSSTHSPRFQIRHKYKLSFIDCALLYALLNTTNNSEIEIESVKEKDTDSDTEWVSEKDTHTERERETN